MSTQITNKYTADVISRDDYFPACPDNLGFGMLLPNRHEAGNEYRYGYQGSEKDDEIKQKLLDLEKYHCSF